MPGRIEFDVKFNKDALGTQHKGQGPMQILLMGNFSGHRQYSSDGQDVFKPLKVDLDNFDQIMARIAPCLKLSLADTGKAENTQEIELRFEKLEDFHPDYLYDRLALFRDLKELRAKLGNPATFDEAVSQLRPSEIPPPTVPEPPPQETGEQVSDKQGSDIFGQLLEDKPASIAAEPTKVKSSKYVDINTFIKNAIAPHIEAGAPAQQDSYIESVDITIGELMRSILHHPDFQALEAAWRSVNECVTRLELDEELRIYLLDATKEQIQTDFSNSADNISASEIYQSVVEHFVQTLGGNPWSLLVGLYEFTNAAGDIETLRLAGQFAYHAGGPFVAGAKPELLGCDSLVAQPNARDWVTPTESEQKLWNDLREFPYAQWLGLTFPRFLLRLPYGKKSEEIERFDFEELEVESINNWHEHYLWGNSAVICAVLAGQSFQQNGWSMELGDVLEYDDLPFHVFEQDGERTIKPGAEVVFSERSAEVIEGFGIMPVMSYKDRNIVRLWRFRSLDRQNTGLAGPWR